MRSAHIRSQGNHFMHHGAIKDTKTLLCSVIGVQINGGWGLPLIGMVYGSMLRYLHTNILIGLDLNATCHSLISLYSRAVPDKVGGNYWRHAWLSSQGHFFCCCSDWTKLQGFSLAYDFRTPQHFSPSSTSSVFISAAHFSDMHGYCKCVSARADMHAYMQGKEESVTSAAFDSASNNRRTRFLLFSFSKVGHELYSATRNYQPCGNL